MLGEPAASFFLLYRGRGQCSAVIQLTQRVTLSVNDLLWFWRWSAKANSRHPYLRDSVHFLLGFRGNFHRTQLGRCRDWRNNQFTCLKSAATSPHQCQGGCHSLPAAPLLPLYWSMYSAALPGRVFLSSPEVAMWCSGVWKVSDDSLILCSSPFPRMVSFFASSSWVRSLVHRDRQPSKNVNHKRLYARWGSHALKNAHNSDWISNVPSG